MVLHILFTYDNTFSSAILEFEEIVTFLIETPNRHFTCVLTYLRELESGRSRVRAPADAMFSEKFRTTGK